MGLVDSIAILLDDDIGTLDNVIRGGRITADITRQHVVDAYKEMKSYETDLNNGVWRTMEAWNFANSDRQVEIAGENEAILALLEASVCYGWTGANYGWSLATNPISKLVAVVLGAYLLSLPDESLRKMALESGVSGAQSVVISRIRKRLKAKIIQEIVESVGGTPAYKAIAKKLGVAAGASKVGGVGKVLTLLQLQGLAHKAAQGSRRLHKLAPWVHGLLRQDPPSIGSRISKAVHAATDVVIPLAPGNFKKASKLKQSRKSGKLGKLSKVNTPSTKPNATVPAGLDMLYFLAEPHLRPYVIVAEFAHNQPEAFRKFAEFFDSLSD